MDPHYPTQDASPHVEQPPSATTSSGSHSPGEVRAAVHRLLWKRISAVAVVVAIGVGGATYLHAERSFERQVAGAADEELARLSARAAEIATTRKLSPTDAFATALDERLQMRIHRSFGRFVYARIFAPGIEANREFSDPEFPLAADVTANRAVRPSGSGDRTTSERLRADRAPLVRVLAPLRDGTGAIRGEVELIFAAASTTATEARRQTLALTAGAVGVVLLTAGLIYPVVRRLLERLAESSARLLDANLSALALLGAAIAKRDSDTDAHNYRVTLYSTYLGTAVGLTTQQMQVLLKGAFLHDVGKIGIRDTVLLKPARLTEAEFSVMRTHVEHGVEMVSRSPWLADAAEVVGSHHEKFDGSGYPRALRGNQIPITARIFAVVDVFDALTSRRPYKEALSFDDTIAVLQQGRDTHFDGRILDAFLPIAPGLFQRYGGREDEGLRDEVRRLSARYFPVEAPLL